MARVQVRAPAPARVRWRTGAGGLRLPRLGRRLSDRNLALLMVLPALLLMLAYVLYPLWGVVSSSLLQWDSLNAPGHWVGLDNFRWLLTGGDFLFSLGRSVYYTVGNIVIQTVLGFAIALLLNAALPGRNVARGAIFFPFVVPAVVAALIFGFLFNDLTGVVNYLLLSWHLIKEPLGWLSLPKTAMNTVILISVWKYIPFMIILFLARLQTVPTELVEAARTDGATAWQLFRFVILPWMLPVVLVAVMLRTIWSFNEYDIPFLMTQGGPDNSTLVLPVLIRQLLLDNLDLGRAAAVSAVMIAILGICGALYLVVYRHGERVLEA